MKLWKEQDALENNEWPVTWGWDFLGTLMERFRIWRMGKLKLVTFSVWKESRGLGNQGETLLSFPVTCFSWPDLCVNHGSLPQNSMGNNNIILIIIVVVIKSIWMRGQKKGGKWEFLASVTHHLGLLCIPQFPPLWTRQNGITVLEGAWESSWLPFHSFTKEETW